MDITNVKTVNSVDTEKLYDVVIIGGGPAGLTAAIYLARACYRVLVVEKENYGGQITITSDVVNYPGIYHTSGAELTESMRKQAESFGAEFMLSTVTDIDLSNDVKRIITNNGVVFCFGVLIATGAHPRMINFKGEEKFKGRGVAYCATCDGEFFKGKEVFVIGGGFAAAEESVFLTKYAKHITLLVREDDFTCAKSVADKARNHKNITVLVNREVDEVFGDNFVQGIRYYNNKTNEVTEYKSHGGEAVGVFVFAGYEPATAIVKDIVQLDEQGYVITDRNQKTNVDGIYAAGDVCVKSLRQVITAAGDGASAATELERYASYMQKKTGLIPKSSCEYNANAENIQSDDKNINKNESANNTKEESSLFTKDMMAQLNTVFEKMENPLTLKLFLDDREVSKELEKYIKELSHITNKINVKITDDSSVEETPCVKICRENGEETGLAFHGVPGGHEFTSFVLGLYNASGSGQKIDEETKSRIIAIDRPTKIQVMVSLSCTMCPETVTASQKIASLNKNISAEVYDINHFNDIKEKYEVLSVPCIVINENQVAFGKKNINQVLDLIDSSGR